MNSSGRINVYIGEELRHALRQAALEKKQTIGEYLAVLLRKTLKIEQKTK